VKARVQSFAPLSEPGARVLVLGSMPGIASLQAHQYYAHPRNAFWSVIEALFGIERSLCYDRRCRHLVSHGIALWDVLETCHRPGSLDANIDASSIVVNDFPGFFTEHPAIGKICFNGAAAEKMFLRHALPALPEQAAGLPRIRLPSTSPAHAAMTLEQKIETWRAGLF
jgi:hypoxanthine-DNA glycosylase